MSEEMLGCILEGKIPLKDVCSWLLKEDGGTQSFDNYPCTRGEFALCILNVLRQSSARSSHASGSSSPTKSITKGKSSFCTQSSRNSEKSVGRRTQLFPSPESSTRLSDVGKNRFKESLEHPRTNMQECGVQNLPVDKSAVSSSASSTPQTPNSHPRGYLQKITPNRNSFEGRLSDQNPFLTPEIEASVSSSPFTSSLIWDGSPHLTPIQRRQNSMKLMDQNSPTVMPSPPESLSSRNHSRSSGICLGDFIAKTGTGPRSSQYKKRLNMSPISGAQNDMNASSQLSVSPVLAENMAQSSSTKKNRKHKRRINPTKVPVDDANSCSQTGFREVPCFGSLNCQSVGRSAFQELGAVESSNASQSFSEERYLLKQERLRLQSQSEISHCMTTPTKLNVSAPINVTPAKFTTTLHTSHVSFKDHLLIFCELYCTLLNANLVPNLMSELYFVFSLLVVQSVSLDMQDNSSNTSLEPMIDVLSLQKKESEDSITSTVNPMTATETPPKIVSCNTENAFDGQKYLRSVSNCVFFATQVLWYQRKLLCYLDRVTLKVLWENERIALFMPQLVEYLGKLYSNACGSGLQQSSLPTLKTLGSGNVAYQSETDNSSNFPSAQSFSNFRKQRDGFYELLTIWEGNHMAPGWNFSVALGSKVRSLLQLHSDPVNYAHLARLFRLQLIATVGGESVSLDEGGSEDLQFLQRLGVDPEKLNRLKERLVTPLKTSGPRPPPSFPGLQEFYRDFIYAASSFIFIQHLQDSLISHLMELNQTPFMASDMEDTETSVEDATRHSYLSCVSTMRLLAKFLGLIISLPYQRPETKLSDSIVENEVSVRSKVVPPLNIFACVVEAYQAHRLIVTLPWVVEFLGMMDSVSLTLPYYQSVLRFLFHLYVNHAHGGNVCKNDGERVMDVQSVFMLRLCLGWLFESPVFSESIFYSWFSSRNDLEIIMASQDLQSISKPSLLLGDTSLSTWNVSGTSVVSSESTIPVDSLNLINREVLYAICPFLVELRAILAAVPGTRTAPRGSVRHITPVSASFAPSSPSTTVKQLELQLEEGFFHGLPASVQKTVEFVVERVTSGCVKHICNVWLPGLKQNGLQIFRETIKQSQKDSDETDTRVLQRNLSREVPKIVEHVSTNLKSKCRSGVNEVCAAKCRGALMALLSEDSLGTAVCEMCVAVATRMSIERVVTWMQTHATLTMYSKELQSEVDKTLKRERSEAIVLAKTSHIAPGDGASWEHDDAAPSPAQIIQSLKVLVCDVLDGRGENISKEYVMDFLDKVEQTVTKRQDVIPAAERVLATLIVDLVVALVCHCPHMVDSAMIKRLIGLWKLDALRPVEDGLSRLVCPRNMLLLAQSVHPQRFVWEKLADVVAAVLIAHLVTAEIVENQCLAIMQQEWPQSILRSFAMCMNEVVRQYTKQKDVDCKFVLLMEWLAETMVQIDYFPDL